MAVAAQEPGRTVEYVRPWLYQKQRDAIFCDERYGLIEASTKAGKTVGCIAWLYEQAYLGAPGRNYWWVAPIYPQADIAYRRLKRTLPRDLHKFNDSKPTIELPNQAVIWFKGADKTDSLYGEDVYAAVGDEASRWKEEAWFALRTTLTQTRAPVRLIGNVKGRKNFFYKMARLAEAGEPNMHYGKITAYDAVDAGVLQADEIEDAKRNLPEGVFRELYLAEASDDGGNPFGIAAISACIADTLADPVPGRSYVAGVDLAKSVDFTVVVIIDVALNVVVHIERFQADWDQTIARIQRVASRYNRADLLVDATGVGDPIVEQLQRLPYV